MSNSEERTKDIWNEIIVKESLKTILKKIEENEENNRQIIKEELTTLWNTSEIPTFKQILEKLSVIQTIIEQKSDTPIINQIIKEEEPQIVAINVIGRTKEPIIMDISKMKPKMTKGVKRVINNLAELHKLGKF